MEGNFIREGESTYRDKYKVIKLNVDSNLFDGYQYFMSAPLLEWYMYVT